MPAMHNKTTPMCKSQVDWEGKHKNKPGNVIHSQL